MAEGYEFDLICIGSGPAGRAAAVEAARFGKRACVIEKHRIVGGVSVDSGTIPSKTFREAVVSLADPPRFDCDDHHAYHVRPTAEQLLSRVDSVIRREVQVIEDTLRRDDVTVFQGVASFRDAHTVVVEAEERVWKITGEYILIAVGTRPAPPPSVAPDNEVVITSDGILRLRELPHTMAVVGGGVIGIEYASIFASLDIDVTLVDRRPRPLEFLDEEIVDELIHQMRNRNVTFRLDEAVEHVDIVDGPHRRGVVILESGKRIVADLILFALGRIGDTEALNLKAVGLEADDRGRLQVDTYFRTPVPHIFAAGDIIGFPALAATSAEQGRLVACYAFDKHAEPMASHFPVGIYSIPEVSMVGSPEHELTEKKVPYETGVAHYRDIARGQILGDDTGMFKMLFHRETRQLLGAHCIGTGATELVHIAQAVLGLGGGLDYFQNTVFNYPTLAECYKVAAHDALKKLETYEEVVDEEATADAAQ